MRKDKVSDLWETPQWLFDELNAEFKFTVDVCASKSNSKCDNYLQYALDESSWPSNTNCFIIVRRTRHLISLLRWRIE